MGQEVFAVDNNTPHPPPPSMTYAPPMYDEVRAQKYARMEHRAERALGELTKDLFNAPVVHPNQPTRYDVFPVFQAEVSVASFFLSLDSCDLPLFLLASLSSAISLLLSLLFVQVPRRLTRSLMLFE